MDLVSICKDKLNTFRIRELKEVLAKLGLSKQGKKQDLIERILSTLSDDPVTRMCGKKHVVGKEEVANIVEDAFSKMQGSGATELASKAPSVSDTSTVKPKELVDDSYESESRTRCPCGSSLSDGSMIKCDDARCEVWQHLSCVIIPEKPSEGDPALPQCFYCEICRLNRADPFLVTLAHPLNPVKLTATNVPTDGSNPVQSVEKTFQLSRADKDLLIKQDYDVQVQAWCMLLNDKVPFRMQWPQYADLQVNGMPIRAINRPGSQLLGANGRDDGPIITPCIKDGINKISLSGCDSRIFCLGVRTVKRYNVQQIINMIPEESKGEPFEDALSRVRRCVNGGASNDNADSDSDLEVVADSIAVNLRCPMSGSRMKVAGRFKPCLHMGCFDLHVFVEMNQRSRKWQCPICLKNYALENVIIDPYFNLITTKMLQCGEDVTEVEVKPDGAWRVKTKTEMERRELGNLAQWHLSDGSLYLPPQREIPIIEDLKQVKQEGHSDGHPSLKLEIKKNRNGIWQVRKPEDLVTSSGSKIQGSFEQKNVLTSSSATESGGRGGEDPSVNQIGGGNFDISTNNGIELDSVSLKADRSYDFGYPNPSSSQANPEIVVLSDSDSDSDEEPLVSSGTAYNNSRSDASGGNFSVPPSVSYADNPTHGVDGTSCLGLYNANDDEYGIPLWPLPVTAQSGPGLQLFSADVGVSETLTNTQHGSMNGYISSTDTALGSRNLVPDSSNDHYNTNMNDGLVDNPMTFGGEDPSLQIFLPTRPSDALVPSDMRDQAHVSNGIRSDDWISLRLGGGASSSPSESPAAKGLSQRKQLSSNENAPLLSVSDSRSDKTKERSDSPFSFPRQKRSVRQRLYLSIDSDTE